ncbi:TadE/TadG family type IV pilus assembly protein [uncultured Enterovirga sp.]|uniref:TadE/TadG family type IV pilus assembly protein n=1 Tax=uncultured Enterovirga sp. TaxID=2026352 RepID=UPI0035CAAB2B
MLALALDGIRARAHSLARRAILWPRAVEGVAAVEFALILPVMVVLFFGLSEVTLAVNIDRKLTLLTRSLADLSSRTRDLTTSEMNIVFGAAGAIMRPYNTPAPQMVVSSIAVTKSGSTYSGAVEWSCPKNLPQKASNETQGAFDARTINDLKLRKKGDPYAVPAGFQSDTTKSFILSEAQYLYVPVFGQYFAPTGKRLNESTPWPVRDNDRVTGPSSCP